MAKNRTNKLEYEKRIFTIQGWIVEGIQTALIIRSILENKWCESKRHAERMLKAATDLWTEGPTLEIEKKRKIKVAQLEQQKRTMKESFKGTPAGMRAILAIDKEIILLEGLRKSTKEVPGKFGLPVQPEPDPDTNVRVFDASLNL